MCVWMMPGFSSLTWPSLIGLCAWVRLPTCTLSNQCAEVKPAISAVREIIIDGKM